MMHGWIERSRSLPWRRQLSLGLALSLILMAVAAWFWRDRVSYMHPGPALTLGALAVAVGLVGWALSSLQTEHAELTARLAQVGTQRSALAEQLAAAEANTLRNIPTVVGFELLVQRWLEHTHTLSPNDRVMLFEQMRMIMMVAQFDANDAGELTILKIFPGTKIERSVLLIQSGKNAPLVLKIDRAENIRIEARQYHEYAEQRLGTTPGTPKVCRAEGRIDSVAWGAITYNLAGYNPSTDDPLGQIQTLGEFIGTHNNHQIIHDVLNHVFWAINPWWGQRTRSNTTLSAAYKRLKEKRSDLEDAICKVGQVLQIAALEQITSNEAYLTLGEGLKLRNPFQWLKTVFEASNQLGEWASDPNQRYDSIIHGDFHLGNILISANSHGAIQAWLIDFPHTHVGPTFQDLARLEADIKFGLFPIAGADCAALYALEMKLLPAFTLPQPQPGAAGPASALELVGPAVAAVRTEARRYLVGLDVRPYYLALLHATLPMLAYRDRSPQQKLYAFISCALLCAYLDAPSTRSPGHDGS